MMGQRGNLKVSAVAINITNDALGTAATPLLVSINDKPISNCSPKDRSIPAACATKMLANDRYNVVPSRLKVYPVGITNDTIFLGTPNFSIFSSAFGNAESELVVANAIDTGSLMACMNFRKGIFVIKIATGNSTNNKKAISATYQVIISKARFYKISIPKCPTVTAMAAPTPNGAKYMMILVNLNIVSARLSENSSMGFFFFSLSSANAMPKMTLKKTIGSTLPS